MKENKKCCETCSNLLPCGEGDHMCLASENKVPLIEYSPTTDYFWCCGIQWRSNKSDW